MDAIELALYPAIDSICENPSALLPPCRPSSTAASAATADIRPMGVNLVPYRTALYPHRMRPRFPTCFAASSAIARFDLDPSPADSS